MGTFIERLIEEEIELSKKIEGLDKTLNTENFNLKVGEFQFNLLNIQIEAMKAYKRILEMRIKDLTK